MNELLSLPEKETLLHSLRRGEEQAYRQLFEQYYVPLTAFALRYLGGQDSAKEVVQNTFVVLYQRR
ncbi:MAG: RNA polymerase sigma factor, partial [Cyclobacteriaceae bacterium]